MKSSTTLLSQLLIRIHELLYELQTSVVNSYHILTFVKKNSVTNKETTKNNKKN